MLNITVQDPFDGAGDFEPKTFVHVGLVDRRNYMSRVDLSVYLPKGNALVLEMQPAKGESRRNPASYLVKVFDQDLWQIRTEVMRATQPLVVQ